MNIHSFLFTGGGGAGSESIFRLMKSKYHLHFADADYSAISTNIDNKYRHTIPFASDDKFISEIISLCDKYDVNTVVPGVDEELLLMQKLQKQTDNLNVMAPDYNYSKVMLDKLTSMQFLDSLGIPVPKTVLLEDTATLKFPCIAKPRSGRGSRDVFTINKPESISAYSQLTGISKVDAVAQELLSGSEYTVTMVADAQNVLRKIIPVYVEQKRGITIRAKIDNNKKVIEACRRIHEAAPTRATYNIQLMLTTDGEVKPFEINPRVSTTFCLILAAGIDPLAAFLGEDNIGALRNSQKLQRYWLNEFSS